MTRIATLANCGIYICTYKYQPAQQSDVPNIVTMVLYMCITNSSWFCSIPKETKRLELRCLVHDWAGVAAAAAAATALGETFGNTSPNLLSTFEKVECARR